MGSLAGQPPGVPAPLASSSTKFKRGEKLFYFYFFKGEGCLSSKKLGQEVTFRDCSTFLLLGQEISGDKFVL